MRGRPRIVVVSQPALATVAGLGSVTVDHTWSRASRVLLLRAELAAPSLVDLGDLSLSIVDDKRDPIFGDTYGARAVSFRALAKRPRRAVTAQQPSGLLMHRIVRARSTWRITVTNADVFAVQPTVYFLVEDL